MKRPTNWPLFLLSCLGIALWALVINAQQPPPPLPALDSVTIQDLKDQIGDCAINARNANKYEAKLIARIRELERDLEIAKVHLSLAEESKAQESK